MHVLPTYITVRSDDILERAIASEVTSTDDKDLTESYLNQMSVQYPSTHVKKTNTVVEVADNEGQDIVK